MDGQLSKHVQARWIELAPVVIADSNLDKATIGMYDRWRESIGGPLYLGAILPTISMAAA